MKRTAFDDRRDQRVADEAREGWLPCQSCQKFTLRETLVERGAKCQSCFDSYCARANPSWLPNRQLTHSERASIIRRVKRVLAAVAQSNLGDKRNWARSLRDREDAGERLSPMQSSAWREALGASEEHVEVAS